MAHTPGLRSRDFQRVYAGGGRARSGGVKVTALVEEGSPSRLGVGVSRHTGNAVVRNRIRRRIKAVWATIDPPPGTQTVIGASAACTSVPFQELADNVRTALSRALGGVR